MGDPRDRCSHGQLPMVSVSMVLCIYMGISVCHLLLWFGGAVLVARRSSLVAVHFSPRSSPAVSESLLSLCALRRTIRCSLVDICRRNCFSLVSRGAFVVYLSWGVEVAR